MSKYLQWAAALMQPFTDAAACASTLAAAFDLSVAVGPQLDALGLIIGASRTVPFTPTGGVSPVLDDGTYRLLLKAKVIQNQWNGYGQGKYSTLWDSWQQLFPGGAIFITDNQNMTATILMAGAFSQIILDLINNGMIVPRPQTVQYTYAFVTLPIFGADFNNSFIAGADTGFTF